MKVKADVNMRVLRGTLQFWECCPRANSSCAPQTLCSITTKKDEAIGTCDMVGEVTKTNMFQNTNTSLLVKKPTSDGLSKFSVPKVF